MCGRFALHASEEQIISHFQLKCGFSMRSRYNIAPTQMIPVIIQWQQRLEFSRWGFIPSWAKGESEKVPLGHINARQETLSEKPAFKAAYKSQRCLIPASGYFEWRDFSGKKQPFYISIKDAPLIAFAGIWSYWHSPSGLEMQTCAIITQKAAGKLQKLHERMPVIVEKANYGPWLQARNFQLSENLSTNLPLENLMIYPVTAKMGNPRFEGIECVLPL